ncbi:MAG TPA: DUF2017 domain-containing protein [Streptosporangiaceae bacterium]|jgi:hypothetical protein|nr:DUF2017 domain-containing protein [Streptosporangiaceae bacterium]
MDAFRRSGGGVRTNFDAPEAALLRSLIEQIMSLLDDSEDDRTDPADPAQESPSWDAGPDHPDTIRDASVHDIPGAAELDAMLGFSPRTRAPLDPALARLLPDAYRDDPDASGEFRRYTEQSLRSAKQEVAQTVLDTLPADGGRVKLSHDQAQAWLRALNDVRLTLGVRLGVTEEFEDEWRQLDPLDPRATAFEVYAWLGDVQESLVQALS